MPKSAAGATAPNARLRPLVLTTTTATSVTLLATYVSLSHLSPLPPAQESEPLFVAWFF